MARHEWKVVGLGAVAWCAAIACGTSSNSGPSVTCGAGTEQQGQVCVATATDAGAAHDATTTDAGDAESDAGEVVLPPTFSGLTGVAPVSNTRLLVVWSLGVDTGDEDEGLSYRVYASPSSAGPLTYTQPVVQTLENARSAYLDDLQPNVEYVVGVRAVNEEGVADSNVVTLTATPQNDATPPTFDGLASAVPGTSGAVALAWKAASDDLTPAPAMTYLVFMSDTPGGEDFSHPTLVSGPGDVSAQVHGLPNATVQRYFVVRARDAGGNVDTNTTEIAAAPAPDTFPPVFAGCSAATLVSPLAIGVSWIQATDDTTAQANIAYDIFASTTSGQYDFTQPFATVHGTDTALIPGLLTSTRYYFICRAKDEAGNEDQNTAEVSAKTGNNAVPPTFAGITTFTGDPVGFTATIGWNAGTDDTTPQNLIVYDVYESTTAGNEAFTRPPIASSAAGATTITVTDLTPNATLFFVVRARDQDGNHDSNVVEKSMSTNVSFVDNVQPIFAHDCGVVGCHVPGNPTGGLILAQGFAYAQVVGVAALELSGFTLDGGAPMPYINPGDPSTSFLNLKINSGLLNAFKAANPSFAGHVGTQMPAPSTGSTLASDELTTIANWITQGAVQN